MMKILKTIKKRDGKNSSMKKVGCLGVLKMIGLAAFILLLFACSTKEKKAEFSVVATSFPCYDAARACLKGLIDDEKVSLKLMIKPGAEVHSFDPSPADMINVNDSDVFIFVGGESDEWVEKVLAGTVGKKNQKFVKLIDSVETVAEDDFGEDEETDSESMVDEVSVEEDEHIWTSPKNEVLIVRRIAEEICAAYKDSGLSEKYGLEFEETVLKNSQEYISQIMAVEQKTKAVVAEMKHQFIVMADRFPLRYFADYYGLKYDAAFSGCSSAVEASPSTISRLIDEVETKKLKSVYYIELGNHKIADSVAESAGVEARILYSVQNVSKDDFDAGETWVSLMDKNAETLRNN